MAADLILAFDTSAAHCAAALLRGTDLVVMREEAMAKGQAERLISLLEELLDEAGAGWSDLCGLAVGIGPGNFTGVRIAVAAARGLSLALGIPAAGVSTLEALAHGQPGPVIALGDARRGEVHAQGFGTGPGAPIIASAAELAPTLPANVALVGDGAAAVAALRPDLPVIAPAMPLACAMARIAATRLASGVPLPRPAPLYLRAADAAPPSDQPPVILP